MITQITSRDNCFSCSPGRLETEKQRVYLCRRLAALRRGASISTSDRGRYRFGRTAAKREGRECNQRVIAGVAAYCASEKLLESISYTKTPQGIVVLARRPESSQERLAAGIEKNSLLVVLHQINNPVNVGAILRTAEAAGASGVITTRNTSDPFSPKSLRGAMGSAFRLPIWSGPTYKEMIDWCREREIATVCADADASLAHTECD